MHRFQDKKTGLHSYALIRRLAIEIVEVAIHFRV